MTEKTHPAKPERNQSHSKDVGGILVRRALPGKGRRMIGAWCFLDHLGPAEQIVGQELNVGPHPHIGLQTFTWMIEGRIRHRDSLGYNMVIQPGQVNLMTAGKGITHSEENYHGGRIHAAQLWIALPDAEHHREPDFQHYPDLPIIAAHGLSITLLAGKAFDRQAPTQVYTPLVGMDLLAKKSVDAEFPLQAGFEHGFMCLSGQARIDDEPIEPGILLYLAPGRETAHIQCDEGTRLLLVGGEPFREDIILWWNFVARTQDEIAAATADWNAGRHFPDVPGTPLARLLAPEIKDLVLKAGH